MTYERVTLVLTEHEMKQLRRIAQEQRRRPRDQAAVLLSQILTGSTILKGIDNNSTLAFDNAECGNSLATGSTLGIATPQR